MLLYIHVPFCRRKCAYCTFYSLALDGNDARAVRVYLAGLLGELRLWGERLGSSGRPRVETVFFGGGTPSILPAKAIDGFLREAGKVFDLAPNAEISAEANPESALADGWLFEARAAGVNRLSLGVQSFDDEDLLLLGRAHDARAAEAAFATARMANFSNISIDLMWGLPGPRHAQSQMQWLRQIRKVCELQPEHVSAYGLTLEEGASLIAALEQGDYRLPSEKELSSMYLAGADFLESRGYMQYEISNYARMGFECRHNLGYWEGADYLGLGPAASSTLNGRRWTNPSELALWKKAVERCEIASTFESLDQYSGMKELLMLRLRMSKGLSLAEWRRLSGKPFMEEHGRLAALLQKNGLAAMRKDRFRLTRAGMLVSDTIIAHFFESINSRQSGAGGSS